MEFVAQKKVSRDVAFSLVNTLYVFFQKLIKIPI